jgi:4-hydroxybenzoate polyprenyltransferase
MVLLGTIDFCLLASSVYILNDVVDRRADALHPEKRGRPIAAGRIAPSTARVVAWLLAVTSLAGAWHLDRRFGALALGYFVLQIVYSGFLKRVAILDVFVIAMGFVLRAIAGAAVVQVRISPWLLLCAFLLALFLALCKRRHEKHLLLGAEAGHRQALAGYTPVLLDQMIAVVAAATIMAYALYTLNAETAARFGTHGLGFTIPFVLFGIFRYLELVYAGNRGGRPEQILLTDRVLIATILLYGLATLTVFLIARHGFL